MDDPGVLGGGRAVIDPVHVRHQYGQVGLGLGSHAGGQRVVVPDGQEVGGGGGGVLLGRRGADGVVGVDDGDDVQLEELVDRGEELLAGLVVVEVGLGDQDLGTVINVVNM